MQTMALKMGEGSSLFYSEWIWASALLQQMNPLVNISAQAGKEDKTETILQNHTSGLIKRFFVK